MNMYIFLIRLSFKRRKMRYAVNFADSDGEILKCYLNEKKSAVPIHGTADFLSVG